MDAPTLGQFLTAFPPGLLVAGVVLYVLLYAQAVFAGLGALFGAVIAGALVVAVAVVAALGVCTAVAVAGLIAFVVAVARHRR